MSNLRTFKRKVARSRARWQSGGRSGAGGSSDRRPLHGPRSATPRRIRFVWPPTAGEDKAKLLTPLQKRIREEERQILPGYLKAMRRLFGRSVYTVPHGDGRFTHTITFKD